MSRDAAQAIVAPHRERLAGLCRRRGIRRLALFGSALRDDFRPDSDVDLLVEFEAGRTPGLAFFALQDELSALLGRTVDLNTPADLSRSFRDDVLRSAEVIYDAGSGPRPPRTHAGGRSKGHRVHP